MQLSQSIFKKLQVWVKGQLNLETRLLGIFVLLNQELSAAAQDISITSAMQFLFSTVSLSVFLLQFHCPFTRAVPYDTIEDSIANTSEGEEDCGCGGSKLTREAVGGLYGTHISSSSNGLEKEEEKLSIQAELNKKMVKITGGRFFIGTDNPLIMTDGESPRRPAAISTFMMDIYEVSNADYALVCVGKHYKYL